MPVKSKSQMRLMQAAAHGAKYGPSEKVAKEFLAHGSSSHLPERKKKNVRKNS